MIFYRMMFLLANLIKKMKQTTIFDVFILFFLSSYGERRFKKLY